MQPPARPNSRSWASLRMNIWCSDESFASFAKRFPGSTASAHKTLEATRNEPMIADVKMSTLRLKRPHRKVRSGCTTCKRARVKCDEKRPRCTRCHRKGFDCNYVDTPRISPSPPDLRAVDNHSDSEPVSSKSPPNPVGKGSPCATNLGDLCGIRDTELAKHYLTHTVQTFAGGGMSDMWRILIPAVALTCPVVRQGMLTLAAICLHYESSLDQSDEHYLEYLEVAEAHGKIFVKESRQKMQDFQEGLRTQDQDSILACSGLLCILGFAFFRTHRQNGTTLSNPAAWTWLHLLRGAKTSYDAVVEAGRPVDEMFMKDMTPQLCNHQPTPRMDVGCQEPCFRYIQQSRRAFIDALQSALYRDWSSLGKETTADLGAAIDLLDQVTEQVCSQQSECLLRTICTWPADLPKSFVELLMGRSPPALVVYAHWLMLMVLVEDLWWIDDMGRAGIRDIIAICSDADRDVRSLLFWPQHMLRVGRESTDTVL